MSEISLLLFNETSENKFNETEMSFSLMLTLSMPTLLICSLGLAGNGVVIWFLCFGIQRNTFTVYILNLSIADFLLLLFAKITILSILIKPSATASIAAANLLSFTRIFFISGYNASLLILTAISVERCASVVYPLWYKCHRPTHLSAISCVFTWIFAIVIMIIECVACTWKMYAEMHPQCSRVMIFLLAWSTGIVCPIMIISSVLLMITVKRSSKKLQPMRLYRIILLNVLVFLIATLIPKLIDGLYYFQMIERNHFHRLVVIHVDIIFITMNSSANPYIYLLVGRSKKKNTKGSIKSNLQRVFKSDDSTLCQDQTCNTMEADQRCENFLNVRDV